MVGAVVKAVESFPKGQVANDIKSGEHVPIDDIDRRSSVWRSGAALLKLCNKLCNVDFDCGLLSGYGPWGKTVPQQSPHSNVVGFVRRTDNRRGTAWEVAPPDGILRKWLMAISTTVDVRPTVATSHANLIWRYPNNVSESRWNLVVSPCKIEGAILLMKSVKVEDVGTIPQGSAISKSKRRPQFGPWDFG